MVSVDVRRPIVIKAVMTESFRQQVIEDTEKTLKNHEAVFAQLEALYEKNKEIATAPMTAIDKQMEFERARLADIQAEMQKKLTEFRAVPEGDEIVYAVVEGVVNVKVGDDLQKLLVSAEIVMKDFKVVELRGF